MRSSIFLARLFAHAAPWPKKSPMVSMTPTPMSTDGDTPSRGRSRDPSGEFVIPNSVVGEAFDGAVAGENEGRDEPGSGNERLPPPGISEVSAPLQQHIKQEGGDEEGRDEPKAAASANDGVGNSTPLEDATQEAAATEAARQQAKALAAAQEVCEQMKQHIKKLQTEKDSAAMVAQQALEKLTEENR